MWKLVIEDDEGKRTVVPLSRDDYSIGRREGNAIRLTERNVSRDHVRLRRIDAGEGKVTFVADDLSSYNGVFVNGIRVATSQELLHGDLIQIGDYRVLYQADQPAETNADPAANTTIPSDAPDSKTTQPSGSGGPGFRGSLLMERPDRLVQLVGPTPGLEYPLTAAGLTIGRAEEASISVNHNSVSRIHCEIQALGEGRFEIVDKGSSNGVRVNGAELRRSIIEAGDVIELGDVRFRFVGAGQVFVAGPNESQQLTAISDRVAPDEEPSRGRSGLLVFALLGALVAGLVIGGVALYLQRRTPPSHDGRATATSLPLDASQTVLSEALALCPSPRESCDSAHDRLAAIPEGAPARTQPQFTQVESAWADWLLGKAAATDASPAAKRALLDKVARAPTVDSDRRRKAADLLESLDKAQLATPTAVNAVGADAAASVATASPPGTTPTTPISGRPSPRTTPPPSAAKTPAATPLEQARAALLREDYGTARLLLYDRLRNGGTEPELRVLREACKGMKDMACVEECKRRLGS